MEKKKKKKEGGWGGGQTTCEGLTNPILGQEIDCRQQCVSLPGSAMFPLAQLPHTCNLCESVLYCHTTCRQRDWDARHKPLCETYIAGLATQGRPVFGRELPPGFQRVAGTNHKYGEKE